MRCSNCNTDNREGRKFCASCGAPLACACPNCGASNLRGEQFCGECGSALIASANSSVSNTTSVQAVESAGERRHLTILFCDLVGSTTLAAQVDPEDWHTTVASYQRAAAEAITGFGGEVARYVGDGIMAFFGHPVAHDNDAERAARAGLAILEAIAQLSRQPAQTRLSVRIGINSGHVVVGAGAGKAVDAFGDEANIAARVQAAAEPDTVVVTGQTHRLISGLFVVEALGAQSLKGIERPVELYRVIQPSGIPSKFEAAAAAGKLTPFVGREDELRLLMSRWERVRDSEGQVVTIIGEAGIGKSRLLQRFREEIADEPYTWLECATAPFFQNTPFYAAGRQSFHWGTNGTAEQRLTALEASLASAGLDPNAAVPLIAPFLELPVGDRYPPLSITPDQQRKRLLATLVDWAFGAAKAQPLVIAIEDLHWVDPSSLELIQLLVEQGATARLLLLCTARSEFRPPWPPRSHHTQLTLSRLNARDVRAMVGEVAARKALSDETVTTVVERTGGVPLFVEELTRAVLESGDAKLTRTAIPVTLHDSLMARLDRLGPAKEVAQIGAVLGNEFSYELLHAVHAIPEPDLQGALRTLTDAELLYARGIAPEANYQFKHALIRDAAYEALLKSRRKELHLSVARTIDKQFPILKETHPEVLARHWTEGGEIELAIAEWQRAGVRAVEHRAYREAEQHYREAIALLQTLPESPDRDSRELVLLLGLGPVLIAIKGWASLQVEQTYMQARELGERSGEPRTLFPSLMGLWVNRLVRSQFRAGYEIGEQLLILAEKANEPTLLLQAHQALGDTSYQMGRFEVARTHLEATLSLCGRERLRSLGVDMEVVARSYLSRTLWFLGYPRQALEMNREAVALAQKLDDPFSVVFAQQFLSVLHQLRREVTDFRAVAERVISICTEHGFAYWLAHATVNLGAAIAEQGRGGEALALINQGLAAASATGAEVNRVDFLHHRAEAYSAMDCLEDALDTLDKALAIGLTHEDLYLTAEIHRFRGELLLRRGNSSSAKAEACFEKGIKIARSQTAKSLELRATTSLARLLDKQSRRNEARVMLAEIYGWFTEGFDTADLKDAKALLDELNT